LQRGADLGWDVSLTKVFIGYFDDAQKVFQIRKIIQ